MTTAIFVHGMYMNDRSWQEWVHRYREHGYTCHAPAWPCHHGDPAQLRADIPKGLGTLRLGTVVDDLARYVGGLQLAKRPVVLGHGMGGLVAQLLAARDLAAAAVCISSATSERRDVVAPDIPPEQLAPRQPLRR